MKKFRIVEFTDGTFGAQELLFGVIPFQFLHSHGSYIFELPFQDKRIHHWCKFNSIREVEERIDRFNKTLGKRSKVSKIIKKYP